MAYAAEISRVNPSCFLFLIDQSSSMESLSPGTNKPKAVGVADAINRLIQNLILKCTKAEEVCNYFEVGVIGYNQPTKETIKVGPAFIAGLAGQEVVPISDVANNPARIDERHKMIEDGAGG